MKVLVTGGCGFLGSHICEHYIEKGWDVIAYDNLTKYELMRTGYNVEGARDYNLKLLEGLGVVVILGDVRDKKVLMKYARSCDYIIHTAAQPAMTIALEDPQLDFEVNVLGTLNVLEVARKYEIPMVNCSTIHIYGNGINENLVEGEDRFYLKSVIPHKYQTIYEDEDILTGKLTPLHASKRAAEIYVQAYIDTYGLKAANFRLTGMYGPRQFGGEDHGWVANFAIRTILGLPIRIYGTDKQVRDILYVTDAVGAFDKWYKKGCPFGTYNIGGGEPCIMSIGMVLNELTEITGKVQKVSLEPARQGDLYYFCCDINKARKEFGWVPKVLPKDGLKLLVDWIEENEDLFIQRVTRRQPSSRVHKVVPAMVKPRRKK